MKDSTRTCSRVMAALAGAIAGLFALTGVGGDLAVDNLTVEQNAIMKGGLKVREGISYVKPLGDISMGIYTNGGFYDFSTLTNGLVAYWPMEEDDAGTNEVADTVGGHTLFASRNTSALHATGKFGGGFLFARSASDQLTTTNWMPSTGQGSWTVSLWWKSSNGAEWDTFITWGQTDWQWGHAVALFTRSYGVNNFCVQDMHDTYWTSSEESDGEWHHLVATLDGSTKIVTLYVDGVSAASGELTCLDVTGPDTTTIGSGYGAAPADGVMDDFRVYDRALSVEEVDALYTYVP